MIQTGTFRRKGQSTTIAELWNCSMKSVMGSESVALVSRLLSEYIDTKIEEVKLR
jgi:hypothetical protein